MQKFPEGSRTGGFGPGRLALALRAALMAGLVISAGSCETSAPAPPVSGPSPVSCRSP